jgi:hypothetical protein
MAEGSIPIAEITLARLRELARWAGISVEEALDRAIKAQYDRTFWEAVHAGYAALRADPEVWAEVEAERKLWDNTLMDGLDPSERWTEDRRVLPPAQPEQAP